MVCVVILSIMHLIFWKSTDFPLPICYFVFDFLDFNKGGHFLNSR